MVDLELSRPHLFSDRPDERFEISQVQIVSAFFAVLLTPIQVGLREFVDRRDLRREERLVRHQGMKLLVGGFTVFTKRDLATVDRAIPRFGLLAKERFGWPCHG